MQCEIKGEFNYLVPSRQLTKLDIVFIFSVRRNANLGGSTYIVTGSSVIPGKGEPLSQAKVGSITSRCSENGVDRTRKSGGNRA